MQTFRAQPASSNQSCFMASRQALSKRGLYCREQELGCHKDDDLLERVIMKEGAEEWRASFA